MHFLQGAGVSPNELDIDHFLTNFAEHTGEVRKTPTEAEARPPRCGTMTNDVGRQEVEDRGFLKEAIAGPGRQVPGGRAVPSSQGGAARQAGAQRGARPGR